ncbi:MAG: hypothetical protein R3C49_10280 [Planctomycetaceae bacterium]
MSDGPVSGLLEVFQQVRSTRVCCLPTGVGRRRHRLTAMLAALICATLCGHQGLRQTVRWLKLHGVQIWHLLIVGDAAYRCRDICETIVDSGGGDYLVTVKAN